jgi:hypothetical protein
VHSGASPAEVVQAAADAAMTALVRHLSLAGCLGPPAPPKPEMTPERAARLLCELSCAPRINPPDEEYGQLLASPAMVTYAWNQAVGAGIPPAQQSDAHEARRVLLAHHRETDRAQS